MHRVVEIVPTVTRPGVLRLFGRYNYQGECQQETMLAIIYLWPTQDSPMHPLVLQCTLKQEPSLNFPHTEIDDQLAYKHSQFNHLLPVLTRDLLPPKKTSLKITQSHSVLRLGYHLLHLSQFVPGFGYSPTFQLRP